MAEKTDYTPHVGKHFKLKGEPTLNADRLFKVHALIESHDFGIRGGKRPAFELHRVPGPGVHTQRCDKFLETHEEVATGE